VYIGSWDGRLYAINPKGIIQWSFLTNSRIDSSPSIGDDGTVYFGSNEGILYALDSNNKGKLKWKYVIGSRIHSTPSISRDGIIYVGAKDGRLYAVNSDGTLKWSYDTGDAITSSATISSDGIVFVGSWSGRLYALNPDGSLKGEYETEPAPVIDSSDVTQGQKYETRPILSSPAIDSQGTVYIGCTDGKFYAFGKGTK
jgi:outer membrane protein assembly factor BamB